MLYGISARCVAPGEFIMAQKLTPSDVKGLFEKHSNWGRWGKDDERGALNYITDK
jgi:hypothetical protein